MVAINLQALCYPVLLKRSGGWMIRDEGINGDEGINAKLGEYTKIPAFAVPTAYVTAIKDALKLMGITIYQIREISTGQCLFEFDSGQKMLELKPCVE